VLSAKAARRAELGSTLVAVDIQPQMIAALEKRARKAAVSNLEVHVASAL
jgi:ubiquinone/menaquinone biosynthesis C-methylase UbiE